MAHRMVQGTPTHEEFHMPAPDATRFRWHDLPSDKPMPLLERKRFIGEKMMISQVMLRQGCHVPTHAHENEQFACIVSGALKFGVGEASSPTRKEVVVSAGEVIHLPSMVPHSADALEDTIVLDIFSPPSEFTGIDRGH
jgi:quercetin dioxygenase-like cupin family protein